MTTADAAPGCPVLESFDPLSPEYLADPYAVLAALPAAAAPVFYAPSIGYYVVTRYAEIEQVFREPQAYSAAVAQAPLAPLAAEAHRILLAGGHQPQPSMVSLDEPAHARLRRPAARAFSVRRVTAMIPATEATACARCWMPWPACPSSTSWRRWPSRCPPPSSSPSWACPSTTTRS